jgi:hypothetical protein
MPRDAFEGFDEPVNIEGDPGDVLRLLMDVPEDPAEDVIEPKLDE